MICGECNGAGITGLFDVCGTCNGKGTVLSCTDPPAEKPEPKKRVARPSPQQLMAYDAEPFELLDEPKPTRRAKPLPPLELPTVPAVMTLAEAMAQFGYSELRPGQGEIIDSVMTNRATIVVAATSFGKSACFQIPALMLDGLTLVVSPLISLMRDQVANLLARGIPAAALTSESTPRQQAQILDSIPRLKLLYVAPERLNNEDFVAAMSGTTISMLVCDESHQISEAGLAYRPKYRLVGYLMKQHRPERIAAFTASATPQVVGDIKKQLMIPDAKEFLLGFERPNLAYEVVRIPANEKEFAKTQHIAGLTRQALTQGGVLIYCMSIKRAEALAVQMSARGIPCKPYHSKLKKEPKETTERDFLEGRLHCVAATCAFGMGVDRPDVRLVIHDVLPGSVEAYYQEAGRAGRDGLPARCIVLYHSYDVGSRRWLIEQTSQNPESIARQKKLLDLLQEVVENPSRQCRARLIREYFGERGVVPCKVCDVCQRSGVVRE